MRTILFLLALTACQSPHHTNRASTFAAKIDPGSKCQDWGSGYLTGGANGGGDVDIALCESGGIVYHCTAGALAPSCKPVADLRPRAPATQPPGPSQPQASPGLAPPSP